MHICYIFINFAGVINYQVYQTPYTLVRMRRILAALYIVSPLPMQYLQYHDRLFL